MSAKQKKKRNKRYSGADARVTAPTIMRVSAEELTPFQEWWRTYKRLVKFILAVVGVITLLALLVVGIIGIVTG